MVHLDYRDVRPIYIQIVEGFRTQILSGVLQRDTANSLCKKAGGKRKRDSSDLRTAKQRILME